MPCSDRVHAEYAPFAKRELELMMDKTTATPQADRRQLQQIIAGLTEGIVLIDPDRSIVWANETALAIHDVTTLAELGATATDYRKKFILKYRNHHDLPPKQY